MIRTAAALCHESYSRRPVGYTTVDDLQYAVVDNYLVFRGTANWQNAIRDARFLPVRSKTGHLVHRGFASAMARLYVSVCHRVPIHQRQGLVATGHSLGGAIALLFAEVYGCRVVTFGCPRVHWRWGDVPQVDHTRVICDDDPVPMVPRMLYRHLCEPAAVLVDSDGGIDVADHSIAVYCKRLEVAV